MKKIIFILFSGLLLTACQATTEDSPYQPTASKADIEEAKQIFAGHKLVDVTDDGFIIVTQRAGNKEYWRTSVIRELGYEIACEKLDAFLASGFIAQIRFTGRGGLNDFYNAKRCDDMATN